MKSVDWRRALYGVFCSASISALLLGAAPSMAAVSLVLNPPDQGTLFLQKTATGHEWRWVRASQTDVAQRIIDKFEETNNPVHLCKLVLRPETGPGVGLVVLPDSIVGLINDYIGIRTTPACSEITGSEALTIALGGVLTGYQVYHTELNFRMKGASIVRIDTDLNGQKRTFILKSPGSVLPTPPPTGATIIECQNTNGVKGACRFVADDVWTSMTITTVLGRVSVDAGGFGLPVSKFSITKLDQVLDCDENKDTVTATDPSGATAVGTRLPSADEGSCDPVPYSLGWDTSDPEHPAIVFSTPKTDQEVVTIFTITWPNAPAPPAGSNGVIGAVGVSQQQFVVAEGFKPLDLCVGTPSYVLEDPPDGPLVLESLDGITSAQDLSPSLSGIQYGCIYERDTTYPESGVVGLKELIYLRGDWKALRP